jgi:hypothetical protein
MRFQIIDQLGHSTLDFDTATPDQLAAAEAKFLELTKGDRKCAAFKKDGWDADSCVRSDGRGDRIPAAAGRRLIWRCRRI